MKKTLAAFALVLTITLSTNIALAGEINGSAPVPVIPVGKIVQVLLALIY